MTLRRKGQTMAGFGLIGTRPIDSVCASPKFWEQPYDVGHVECSKRCSAAPAERNKACDDRANPQQCRAEAVQAASNCQQQFAGQFPPPIP